MLLNNHLDNCRWTFNKGVEYFNEFGISNAMTLRDYLVTKAATKLNEQLLIPNYLFSPIPETIFNTPKSLRYNVLRDLQGSIKAAFTNLKNKNIKYFKMRFKSKKRNEFTTMFEDLTNASLVKNSDINQTYLNITGLKNIKVKTKEDIVINSQIILKKELTGWYVYIPVKTTQSVLPNNQQSNNIIALDPGLRSFFTGTDLNGNFVEIAPNNKIKLTKLKLLRNVNKSKFDLASKNNKTYVEYKNYTRAKYDYYTSIMKIKNYIKELHYKTCNFLVTNYDKVILPKFDTQKLIKKGKNKFNETMLSLNHFSFRELLISKFNQFNKKVIICTEEYTSMTCGSCNMLKYDLYDSKVYKCNNCKFTTDRDFNASYNILRFVLNGGLKVLNVI
jgi:putative transposase